jgi:hypothetical protein
MPLALSLAACGKSKSKTQAAQPSATTRPAAAATAVPTVAPTQAPAAFNQAKLAPALMAMDRVNSLIGANPQLLRDKVTDPQLPFSSVATMGSTLVAQQVSLLYNSFQAAAQPPAGRPFAVQNTVQGYPSVANSTAAFSSLRAAWQGNLFQNVTQQAPLNSPWQESFCQVGNFTTTGGQAQQWFVCMARLGPYIATVSIGGFPGLDVNSVSTVVRAYFEDAARAVQ